MRSLLSGFVVLALFACAVVAIDLNSCLRGSLIVDTAKANSHMRREIKEALGFKLDGNGTIASVLVLSKDRSEIVNAVFAGRHKGRKVVTFEYDTKSDLSGQFKTIPFAQFLSYLDCLPLWQETVPDSNQLVL